MSDFTSRGELNATYNWFGDPGYTLAALGPGWFLINTGEGGEVEYGHYTMQYDGEWGDYEQFSPLPQPDPLAGQPALIRQLAQYGGMAPQYVIQYFQPGAVYLQRMQEVAAYLNYAAALAGYHGFDWTGAIARAWNLQQSQFGPWSSFDDPGQTALKIIAQSGLPNAQNMADAVRATHGFQAGQAAMARAWEQSNQASNLLTTVKGLAQDVGALISSGGFKIIMLPFAVTSAINLANNLAENGITETIRRTAQGAVDSLNNLVSNAQAADAATTATEQAIAAAQAAEDAAAGAAMLEHAGLTYEQFLQATQWVPDIVPSVPEPDYSSIDVFAETDAGMAEALANPVLPPELLPTEYPSVFDETDAGMAEALANPVLPPELLPVDDVLVGGAEGALPSDMPSAAGGAAIPVITASSGAGLLTTAAGLAKAGAGILSILMAGGAGSSTLKPNTIVPPGSFGVGPGVIDPNSLSVRQSSAVPLLLLGAGVLLAMKG